MAAATTEGLPSHMIKCCPCWAGSCCHYGMPECIGCVGKFEWLCCECKGMQCKPITDPEERDICCVFRQVICKTAPLRCYAWGGQCFCFECFFSLCCNLDDLYASTPKPGETFKFSSEPDKSKLYTWSAMCCCISNYYCACPECFGCTGATTCCCLKYSSSCCLCCGDQKVWMHDDCSCTKIRTCVKSQAQCCLFDTRTSIPCDIESPCIFTLLGVTLCNNFACKPGCCVKYLDAIAANPKSYCGPPAAAAVATEQKGL